MGVIMTLAWFAIVGLQLATTTGWVRITILGLYGLVTVLFFPQTLSWPKTAWTTTHMMIAPPCETCNAQKAERVRKRIMKTKEFQRKVEQAVKDRMAGYQTPPGFKNGNTHAKLAFMQMIARNWRLSEELRLAPKLYCKKHEVLKAITEGPLP